MTIGVGKKIGMTQIEDDGKFVGVSVIEFLPLIVTQIKTKEKDGYAAVQVGVLDAKRKSKLAHPQIGHFKIISKAFLKKQTGKNTPYKFREFRLIDEEAGSKFKLGQKIGFEDFEAGDKVSVSGMSIGRGFQGVIKRHRAHRGPETHGSDHHRAPGSIGMCSFPARVFKGKKLPGRDGVKKATIKKLRIIRIIKDNKLMLVCGSVPGKKDSYLGLKLTEKAATKSKPNRYANKNL